MSNEGRNRKIISNIREDKKDGFYIPHVVLETLRLINVQNKKVNTAENKAVLVSFLVLHLGGQTFNVA